MSDLPLEAVSVVLPVRNLAGQLGSVVGGWRSFLDRSRRDFEILLVDDGSTDGTAEKADEIAAKHSTIRVLRQEKPSGYGACLRVGLAEAKFPLVFFTAADYPYLPGDLGKLLERIGHTDAHLGRKLDVVSGCRTGLRTPAIWDWTGRIVRGFCRFALGLPLEASPTWLGLGETVRTWVLWFLFADPLHDPFSAFKLFRKSVFEKFPVQCDGEFAHVEVIAKATFTTCLIDEIPLTPNPTAIPRPTWSEFGKLFFSPEFTPPPPAISPPDPEVSPTATAATP